MPTNNSPKIVPVDPSIEAYMRNLAVQSDHPVLTAMEDYAQEHRFPIVNRLAGIFLETQAKMIGAKRVFHFLGDDLQTDQHIKNECGEQRRPIAEVGDEHERHGDDVDEQDIIPEGLPRIATGEIEQVGQIVLDRCEHVASPPRGAPDQ